MAARRRSRRLQPGARRPQPDPEERGQSWRVRTQGSDGDGAEEVDIVATRGHRSSPIIREVPGRRVYIDKYVSWLRSGRDDRAVVSHRSTNSRGLRPPARRRRARRVFAPVVTEFPAGSPMVAGFGRRHPGGSRASCTRTSPPSTTSWSRLNVRHPSRVKNYVVQNYCKTDFTEHSRSSRIRSLRLVLQRPRPGAPTPHPGRLVLPFVGTSADGLTTERHARAEAVIDTDAIPRQRRAARRRRRRTCWRL